MLLQTSTLPLLVHPVATKYQIKSWGKVYQRKKVNEVYPYLQRYGHDRQHHSNYPFVAKYCVTISVIVVSLCLVYVIGLLYISMLPLLLYCSCLSL